MSVCRTVVALMTAVVLVGAPGAVFAQGSTPPPQNAPAEKTIGVPSTQDTAKVEPSLIVMNAVGAILDDNKLTLTGVAPNAIIFADRPTLVSQKIRQTRLYRRSAKMALLPEMPWLC